MFCNIIAYTPDTKRSEETVVIVHNPATSANYIKSIAEDLMYELLEEIPEAEFAAKWESRQDDWYKACTYECYEVDLNLKDCGQYGITEEEWYEETELWPDDDERF